LRSVAFAGRIVVLGFVSGSFAAARTNVLLVKNAGVLGSAWQGSESRLTRRVSEDSCQIADSSRHIFAEA
jgi:hypothetical protein